MPLSALFSPPIPFINPPIKRADGRLLWPVSPGPLLAPVTTEGEGEAAPKTGSPGSKLNASSLGTRCRCGTGRSRPISSAAWRAAVLGTPGRGDIGFFAAPCVRVLVVLEGAFALWWNCPGRRGVVELRGWVDWCVLGFGGGCDCGGGSDCD